MEKTIQIGGKSVRLSNNANCFLIYRNQFGRDIVPALLPLVASGMDVVSGIIKETGKTSDIEAADILAVLNGETLLDAVIHLGGLEIVDLINLTWALAKTADRSIPDPETWLDGFDEFPLDVIGPEVFRLITKGVVSSKNLKRLESLKETIRPTLTSIQSSSPGSNEG